MLQSTQVCDQPMVYIICNWPHEYPRLHRWNKLLLTVRNLSIWLLSLQMQKQWSS